jgi:hypothetical protein
MHSAILTMHSDILTMNSGIPTLQAGAFEHPFGELTAWGCVGVWVAVSPALCCRIRGEPCFVEVMVNHAFNYWLAIGSTTVPQFD